ncbi:AEC family transporter [Sphingobacterium psychroaquaticum]|nr:AEC family transporter [Sphingobacterium psychroaquaticum]
MFNFLMIAFCLLAGYLVRRFKLVPSDSYKAINIWVIYIGLPATAFKYLPTLAWDNTLLVAVVAPMLILLGSVMFVKVLGRFLRLSKRTAHTLMLVSGLSNTSFVGFPLVASYFGEDQVRWAIICDQVTFMLLSTVGIVIALRGGLGPRGAISFRPIAKRVFSFPPLIGCLLALSIPRFINIDTLSPFFHQLASTVSPLALFSIGMQMSFTFYRSEVVTMSLSLCYKLLLGPALLVLLFYLLDLKGDVVRITAFEMAMPSLVATSMVLQEFKLNVKLGNAIIGVSIILGLLTTWGFFVLTQTFL